MLCDLCIDLCAAMMLCISIYKFKKMTKLYSCIDMKCELIVLVTWLHVIYVYYFIFVSTTIHFGVVKA